MENPSKAFMDELEAVCKSIADLGTGFFSQDAWRRLTRQRDSLREQLESIADQERLLRIGILGSVKAGKSTFLNALFFDGQEVLPRAATPMTASLTCLRHTEGEQKAELHFYTEHDWRRISEAAEKGRRDMERGYEKACQAAKKLKEQEMLPPHLNKQEEQEIRARLRYQMHPADQACLELAETVEEREINPRDYLGRKETVTFESATDLRKTLEEHIGSRGRLTPLVRKMEIYIKHEMLRDIEVVDTPGLNDPVVSRSEETKKHLGLCDVVFMLSRAGQFLGSEDVVFIRNSLPSEGISQAVITASMMDQAALDHLDCRSFVEAFKKSGRNAQRIFESARGKFPPQMRAQFTAVSAMLAACAYKLEQKQPLTTEEDNALATLKKRFDDFKDTPDFLKEKANIGIFSQKYLPEARKRREEIKRQRQKDHLAGQRSMVDQALAALLRSAKSFYEDLQTKDITTLEQQGRALSEGFDSARAEIDGLFQKAASKVLKETASMKTEMLKLIDQYSDIKVNVEQRERRDDWETGWGPWKKKGYDTIVEEIKTAPVRFLQSQMRSYAVAAQGKIDDYYKVIINIEALKKNVKEKLIALFTARRENFQEDRILLPLESALSRFAVPPFTFDNDPYNKKLGNDYPEGKAEGNKIHALESDFENLLQKMGKDLCENLDRHRDLVENMLTDLSINFLKDIEKTIQDDIAEITKLLRDKENSLVRGKGIIAWLGNCLERMRLVSEAAS